MLFNMGPQELVVIGVLAVLLFGKRLPEVARSVGGSYKQFRKGLSEMQAQLQVDDLPSSPSYYSDEYDEYEAPTAPKFEPPSSEPTAAETEEV